jgi:hypothetical protein
MPRPDVARCLLRSSLVVLALSLSPISGSAQAPTTSHPNAVLGAGVRLSPATIEVLSVSTLTVPRGPLLRTTARLRVPPGAHWSTDVPDGSLLLTPESGVLRVALSDGRALIARGADPLLGSRSLDEIGPGETATIAVGDRLVARGKGSLDVASVGQTTTIATLVEMATWPDPASDA